MLKGRPVRWWESQSNLLEEPLNLCNDQPVNLCKSDAPVVKPRKNAIAENNTDCDKTPKDSMDALDLTIQNVDQKRIKISYVDNGKKVATDLASLSKPVVSSNGITLPHRHNLGGISNAAPPIQANTSSHYHPVERDQTKPVNGSTPTNLESRKPLSFLASSHVNTTQAKPVVCIAPRGYTGPSNLQVNGGSNVSNSNRGQSDSKPQQGFTSFGGPGSTPGKPGFSFGGNGSSHTLSGLLNSNSVARSSNSFVNGNSYQDQEPKFAFGRYSRSTALEGLTSNGRTNTSNQFARPINKSFPNQSNYNVSGKLQDGIQEVVPPTVKNLDKDDHDKHAAEKQRRDNLKAFREHVEEDNIKLRRGTSLSTDEIKQLEKIQLKLEADNARLKLSKRREEEKGREFKSFLQDQIKNGRIHVQTGFVDSYKLFKKNG